MIFFLIFILKLLFNSLLEAQQSFSINGSSSVGVGVLYNYILNFTPFYPTLSGVLADATVLLNEAFQMV